MPDWLLSLPALNNGYIGIALEVVLADCTALETVALDVTVEPAALEEVDEGTLLDVDEVEGELGLELGLAFELELGEEALASWLKTTTLAFSPGGTVTTQKAAPPAPSVLLPTISLTPLTAGSILQGRPLQLGPSQTISTPNRGI